MFTHTIPDAEPTNEMHGVGTVVGVALDSNGEVITRFEQPPNDEITTSVEVDSVKILNGRSELSNYPIAKKYQYDTDPPEFTLDEAKNKRINEVKQNAQSILSETDWYVTREQETGKATPQDVLYHRSTVRSKSDTFEQDINDLGTVENVLNYEYSFPNPP